MRRREKGERKVFRRSPIFLRVFAFVSRLTSASDMKSRMEGVGGTDFFLSEVMIGSLEDNVDGDRSFSLLSPRLMTLLCSPVSCVLSRLSSPASDGTGDCVGCDILFGEEKKRRLLVGTKSKTHRQQMRMIKSMYDQQVLSAKLAKDPKRRGRLLETAWMRNRDQMGHLRKDSKVLETKNRGFLRRKSAVELGRQSDSSAAGANKAMGK